MNKIEKALRTFWLDDDDIRNLIGSRIYPGRVPRHGKDPCVVLNTVNTNREDILAGEAAVGDTIIQADVYGKSSKEVDDISELLRNRASGYYGTAGDEQFLDCRIIREGTTVDEPDNASDDWSFRNSRDWHIFFTQTSPTLS